MSNSDLYCFCNGRLAVRRRLQNEGREFFGCSKYGSGRHCSFFSLVERVPIPAEKRPFCNCSKPAILQSAKTERNRGRDFYTCGSNKNCKFFKWFDACLVGTVQGSASAKDDAAKPTMGASSQTVDLEAPHCDCNRPAAIRSSSTSRNTTLEFYACSTGACNFYLKRDGRQASSMSTPKPIVNEQKDAAVTQNEYAMRSEESIRRDIRRLQASLNDLSLLATLPDRGERMRAKLEKLSDALSYKESHPDSIRPASIPSDRLKADSQLAGLDASLIAPPDEPKRSGWLHQGPNPSVRTKPSVDIRALEESLALKYNVKHVDVNENLKSKLYPHQQLCLNWMYERERNVSQSGGPRGGVVADDMGLGKTIQMIALMLTSLPLDSDLSVLPSGGRTLSSSTLIICPLAVATQWSHEIQRHTRPKSLRVHIHHGKDQLKSVLEARCYDVVITTYQTALASFKQHAVLHAIHWFRIILDEAHVIKNHKTGTAKAVFDLQSQTRWMMTATPLQNHLQDMFSVFKFLRFAPFCDEEEWKLLFESQNKKNVEKLRPILAGIMIRRTKENKDQNGDLLIQLPPKHIEIYYLKFREDDQKIYDAISSDCRKAYDKDSKQLLVRLLRLRQACNCMCGPAKIIPEPESNDNFDSASKPLDTSTSNDGLEMAFNKLSMRSLDEDQAQGTIGFAEQKDDDDELTAAMNSLSIRSKAHHSDGLSDSICASCSDFITNQRVSARSCHALCAECISIAASSSGNCPVCSKRLSSDLEKQNHSTNSPNIGDDQQADLAYFRDSPKMEFLLRHLDKIRRESPDEKTVIFSQWTTMLDLIKPCLDSKGIRSTRIDGSMNRKDRQKSVDEFTNDPGIRVFLLSLKCAGVGLNLTAANHCFMLDTWWNYSIEDQAFCRIYRIGQTRPVHIYRLIIEGTIEEKVLELQRRKQKLADSLIRSDEAERSSSKQAMSDLAALLLD